MNKWLFEWSAACIMTTCNDLFLGLRHRLSSVIFSDATHLVALSETFCWHTAPDFAGADPGVLEHHGTRRDDGAVANGDA